MLLVQSSVYYCGSDSWNVPSLKLSANFCCVLLGTQQVPVFPALHVAYSDFTSKSPDYVLSKAPKEDHIGQNVVYILKSSALRYLWHVRTTTSYYVLLSKAGLFSTKLSLPELCYFTRYTQSCHFLATSLNLVTTWGFLQMRVRVKDCVL